MCQRKFGCGLCVREKGNVSGWARMFGLVGEGRRRSPLTPHILLSPYLCVCVCEQPPPPFGSPPEVTRPQRLRAATSQSRIVLRAADDVDGRTHAHAPPDTH